MTAQLSLRERKKLKAMRHIQEVALDLFDQHGYGHVTIERIAAEAEVSPSSIYRYFGTKERIILHDEYDPVAMRALDDELAAQDPVSALRNVIGQMVDSMVAGDEELVRRQMRYAMTEPAVRAGMNRQADEMATFIQQTLAKHSSRAPDSLEIRVTTATIVAGIMAAIAYWHDTDYRGSLRDVMDGALDVLSRGLKVG